MAKTISFRNHLIQIIFIIGISQMSQSFGLPSSKKETHLIPVKFSQLQNSFQQQSKPEVVVLIHGLMRTSLSMWFLKKFLETYGYTVYSYSYPSMKYTIQEHGAHLRKFLALLLKNNPGIKISFVTHSLGGIITREALSKFSIKQLSQIGCLIMLAPPNQGSKLAKLSTSLFPAITSQIKPLAELSSDPKSYIHFVPTPNIKIGIIAGKYDSKVPPEAARLNNHYPIIVNSTHTFIMNNVKTKKLIIDFLKNGSFE